MKKIYVTKTSSQWYKYIEMLKPKKKNIYIYIYIWLYTLKYILKYIYIYIYSFYCKMNYIYEDEIYFLLKKEKWTIYIVNEL